jgi:polyphosphate kinase
MAVSTKCTNRLEMFKGTRNYWRFRTNIDVNIVDHTEFNVIEIVCFCADVMLENRIYLSGSDVMSRIDTGKLESLVAAKREENLRRKKSALEKEARDEVRAGLISDFLLNRLVINLDKEKPLFESSISAAGSEAADAAMVVPKPDELIPFAVDRQRQIGR